MHIHTRTRATAGRLAAGTLTAVAVSLAPVATTTTTAPAGAATTTASTSPVQARATVLSAGQRSRATLGTRFKVNTSGVVTAVKFYKARGNKGVHRASLWTAQGKRLTTVRFRHESRAGWQRARLAKAVWLSANREYVVSYSAPRGRFSYAPGQFSSRVLRSGNVTKLGGVYGRLGTFPRARSNANFFVDVVFSPRRRAAAPSYTPSQASGFPTAATTGHRSSGLPSRGGFTVTTRGAVIANMVINGQLTVRADNVTIRNVYIKTNDDYGLLTYGKNTRIEDATIVGTAGATTAGIQAYDTGQVIARRVDVSGSEDGVRLTDNSGLYDSYVHDLRGDSASHYDSVTADGFQGWTIQHNTIINSYGQTAAVWISDIRYQASEGLLADNYIAGGGWSIYAGPGTGSGLRVLNNVFSTKYFPDCGQWGPVTWWDNTNNTWSGNTWADGPNAGKTIKP